MSFTADSVGSPTRKVRGWRFGESRSCTIRTTDRSSWHPLSSHVEEPTSTGSLAQVRPSRPTHSLTASKAVDVKVLRAAGTRAQKRWTDHRRSRSGLFVIERAAEPCPVSPASDPDKPREAAHNDTTLKKRNIGQGKSYTRHAQQPSRKRGSRRGWPSRSRSDRSAARSMFGARER